MKILLLLAFIIAVADWIAVATHARKLEFLFKPLTMVLLIAWYLSGLTPSPPFFAISFAIGLVLSLAGDILLMLPEEHFIKGVVAFLLAHIAFIVAFSGSGIELNWPAGLIGIMIIAVTVIILRPIVAGIRSAGRDSLIIPIYAYAVVLALTLWSTTDTLFRPTWPGTASILAAGGGLLFFVSDALNVWRRYVREIPGKHIPVMITYHLAQFGLAAGMLLFLDSIT
jgi:alkenylglycerophosphocholine/alkenylglycerophosphoethanolamine hydrolase